MKTPYFLIDENLIKRNCEILERVRKQAGCKILLAQKAFSNYDCYPLISKYLDGTTSSGLFEAKLGREKFGTKNHETHVFAPAFTDDDMAKLVKICNHIVFNSINQLNKHHAICKANGVSVGLRVNPECKTQDTDIYDPCAPFSRFGVKAKDLAPETIELIDGLHFHTLCEQNLEPLKKTLDVFEKKFAKILETLQSRNNRCWVNFGGGHHITRPDYDVDGLIKTILNFKERHNVEVYLEPGEAVVLNSGFLHATVLDIVHNEKNIAILDTSAACHNPDILETGHDYTPSAKNAKPSENPNTSQSIKAENKYKYRLAGNTCLAGDIIGDYTFSEPLKAGSEIVFENMALYTMVKTNMFNGINLPSIYLKKLDGKIKLLRKFCYKDYTTRLGRTK